jgi:hypothetical protein
VDKKNGISPIMEKRLLEIFKEWNIVKTPSEGYHIYLKIYNELWLLDVIPITKGRKDTLSEIKNK